MRTFHGKHLQYLIYHCISNFVNNTMLFTAQNILVLKQIKRSHCENLSLKSDLFKLKFVADQLEI